MMANIMSGSGASDPVEQVYDVFVLNVLIVVWLGMIGAKGLPELY